MEELAKYDFEYLLELLIEKIQLLPTWSIYVISIICALNFLIMFCYFSAKQLDNLTNFISAQTANDRLVFCRIYGYTILFIDIFIYVFLATTSTTLLHSFFILLPTLILFSYIKAITNIFDHVISVKYTPNLLETLEFSNLAGEVIRERDGYYLDCIFKADKLKL